MILVTGGTGFLGSVLIKNLIDAGQQVLAVKRETSKVPLSLQSPLIQWHDADITDYFALENLFPQVRQVYHCAAQISYHPRDAKRMMHTNRAGTCHIVNLCLEFGVRLIHVSSIAALGPVKGSKFQDEETKWEFTPKTSIYSLAKYESEMEVWRGVTEGLDAVIVNPSIIMGIGLGEGRVAANAIFDQVKKGLKFYPSGSVGVVDVSDVAAIMVELMNSPISGQRFILNSENISNQDLLGRISLLMKKNVPTIKANPLLMSIAWRVAKLISFVTGGKPIITRETARASSQRLAYDNTKIVKALDYKFIPIQKTLEIVYNTYYK